MVLGLLKRGTKDIGEYYRKKRSEGRTRVVTGHEREQLLERAKISGYSTGRRGGKAKRIGRGFVKEVKEVHHVLQSRGSRNVAAGANAFIGFGNLGLAPTFSSRRGYARHQKRKRQRKSRASAYDGYSIF